MNAVYASGPFPVFAVSLAAWVILVAVPLRTDLVVTVCGARLPILQTEWGQLAATWLLMLGAMMPPLLWPQLRHLWTRSLHARRVRATMLFLVGYASVWFLALAAIHLATRAATLLSVPASLPVTIGLAALWQGSRLKSRALLRCHELPPLPAFGLAAERASLFFGLRIGVWCASSCGPLMLPAMMVPALHLLLMASAFAIALVERNRRPERPRRRPALILSGTGLLAFSAIA